MTSGHEYLSTAYLVERLVVVLEYRMLLLGVMSMTPALYKYHDNDISGNYPALGVFFPHTISVVVRVDLVVVRVDTNSVTTS